MIKIVADPNLFTVGTGEEVTYRVEFEFPFFAFGTETFLWLIGETENDRTIELFKDLGKEHKVKFDKPGKFFIAVLARLADNDARRGQAIGDTLFGLPFTVYMQTVGETESFMWDPVLKQRSHVDDAQSAAAGVRRYSNLLQSLGMAELLFDLSSLGRARLAAHNKTVKSYEDYLGKLNDRIASTRGDQWVRRPMVAIQRPSGSQDVQLKVYIAQRKNASPPQWVIVDWTHPGDKRLDGEYSGTDTTPELAFRKALATWESDSNYPTGRITCTVPAGVLGPAEQAVQFNTHGANTLSMMADFFEKASFFLGFVAAILTVLPIPGSQVVAAAAWIAFFSGALAVGAATLNIYERHERGLADSSEDAVDALTCAGCLLGVGGVWLRGATVTMRIGTVVRELVFIGDVSASGLQGLYASKATVEELATISNDKSMLPHDKLMKLMIAIGKAAANGVMIYANVKGTVKASAPHPPEPSPLPAPKTTGFGEVPSGSPPARLKKLADPNAKLDLTEPAPATENTKKAPVHTTVVHAEPQIVRQTRMTFAERYPQDPSFWLVNKPDKFLIRLEHLDPNGSGAKFSFSAVLFGAKVSMTDIHTAAFKDVGSGKLLPPSTNNEALVAQGKAEKIRSTYPNGTKALVASELVPMTFDHFEKVRPLQQVSAAYTEDNFAAWDAAVQAKADPKQAILDATPTGKQIKQALAEHGYQFDVQSMELEVTSGQVNWTLDIKK